ncbi:MAG: invasion associated locus B family protein [Pseudomonadota bacterium]
MAAPAMAQELEQSNANEQESWALNCGGGDSVTRCTISNSLFLTRQQEDGSTVNLGRILLVAVAYSDDPDTSERVRNLTMQMPLAVDLSVDAVMQVDEGEETQLPWLQCTQTGCDTSIILDDITVEQFKTGESLQVAFRFWGSEDTNIVPVPLRGFTRALRDLDQLVQ